MLASKQVLAVMSVAAAAAMLFSAAPAGAAIPQDTFYGYYTGTTGNGARHASPLYKHETSNAAEVNDNQVVCVQEHVYPNWPSTSGSFFDQYQCAAGYVYQPLNGKDVDQAYCWVNGASTELACGETYTGS